MYDFHILPSGIIHENSVALIGNGVVVNLPSLFAELKKNDIPIDDTLKRRLVLSDRAHLGKVILVGKQGDRPIRSGSVYYSP